MQIVILPDSGLSATVLNIDDNNVAQLEYETGEIGYWPISTFETSDE